VGRGLFAAAILAVEYLALSFRFDVALVASRGGGWAVVAKLGILAPMAAVVASALLLLRPAQDLGLYARFSGRAAVVHAVALAGFLGAAQRLFGPDPGVSPWWVVPWLLVMVLMASSLLATFFGVRGSARRRRRLVIAGVVVGALAWVAALESERLWGMMATPTLLYAGWLLDLVSSDVVVDRAQGILGLEGFAVRVTPICSGSEGIGLALVLSGAYVVAKRHELRMPRALWLLPLTAVAVWLANGLRIALLMLIGARWSETLAAGAFHSKAGWLLFCLVTMATAWWARRTSLLRTTAANATSWENPSAPLLVPLLAVLAASMLAATFRLDWNWLYGLRVVAAAIAFLVFRRSISLPPWSTPALAAAVGLGIVVAIPWILGQNEVAPFDQHVRPYFADAPAWYLPVWVFLRIVGSVLVAPIVEELAFRGYVMRRLVARDFDKVPLTRWTPLALVGSSLLFGVLHQRWLLGSLAGLVYGLAVARRGRLLDGIVAHATTNALVAAYVLASGNWAMWL
jgi:exosortase E/protease (VPEID-CTERM system)